MNRAWIVPVALLMFAASGCGKREPGPEKVFSQFHDHLRHYARQPSPWYRDQAFALLSAGSKARFEALAAEVNASMMRAADPVEPAEMLRVRELRFDSGIRGMEIAKRSDGRVMLRVTYDNEATGEAALVREDGAWRVELFAESADGEG